MAVCKAGATLEFVTSHYPKNSTEIILIFRLFPRIHTHVHLLLVPHTCIIQLCHGEGAVAAYSADDSAVVIVQQLCSCRRGVTAVAVAEV